MHERLNLLHHWLNEKFAPMPFEIKPITGDASFRRYFRIVTPNATFVAMDAPPQKEPLNAYISLSKSMKQHKVRVPEIYQINKDQGFLLLEDFGDQPLLRLLNGDNADRLYQSAMDTLAVIQSCKPEANTIAFFNKQMIMDELHLFIKWFLNYFLQITLTPHEIKIIETAFNTIYLELSKQPSVFTHRDYHSRNLLVFQDKTPETLGVIDFQDAVVGPVTYDLVSLLKDCYIRWPHQKVIEWVDYYYQSYIRNPETSFEQFLEQFHVCGLQRHLKVLGIFCRLHIRDGKSAYLQDLPLTFDYILSYLRHSPSHRPFFELMHDKIQPVFYDRTEKKIL